MELEFHSISTVNSFVMTSQQILQSDLLDILFEKRNKEYGAYALRRGYQNEMIKALAISVPAIFLLLLLLMNSSSSKGISPDSNEIIVTTSLIPAQLPKPEEQKPPRQKQVQQVKQQIFITPKIVETPPINPVATQTQLINAQVSNVTTAGANVLPGIPPTPPITNGGDGNDIKEPERKKEVAPDRQPQFPGGNQAWLAFLNTHLRPPQELDAGEKRIVNIRFFVDIDGTITNFQVVRSGGGAFDDEVIRVLKKMPKWVPAIQGGQPMAVAFTQPVTFVGQEE